MQSLAIGLEKYLRINVLSSPELISSLQSCQRQTAPLNFTYDFSKESIQ